MTYNFETRTTLTDEETKQLIVVEGLEVSSEIILEAKIKTNTELPQDKVESLRVAGNNLVSAKLGTSETQLISQEH
jgi:hypothetical protein